MRRFAETCEAVAATTKKTEKVRLVAAYLSSLPVDDAAHAAIFFTGRAFPHHEERFLSVGGSLIWHAVTRLMGITSQAAETIYRKHGDLGSMIEELFQSRRDNPAGLSISQVAAAFEDLPTRRGPAAKAAVLEALFQRAEPVVAKYIVKIITGDLRIGLKESLVEEAIAAAFEQPIADVRRANMLTGDIAATLRLAAAGRLSSARLHVFQPIGFMLASPVDAPEEVFEQYPGGALVEDKYDGIRAQAHKTGNQVRLFSRTLDEIVEFSELYAPLAALPGEFVLDGEIVAWRDGRPLPFGELQQRLGRKQPELWLPLEIPIRYMVFDILYRNGEQLLDAPLTERRRTLEELHVSGEYLCPTPIQPCSFAGELEDAFEAALARGNEGIMAKAADSPYAPGRRGRHWLKLKRPLATLDVVVTAVEWGHGKRHGVLSDYTFAVSDNGRLLNIGKAYSGLTDAEILQFTTHFLDHTSEDQGFRRLVEPSVVVEVAFNNIQRSNRHDSGFALRFPRIVRLRPDKSPSEIDTLERVRQIYQKQTSGA